ncbi:MAG: hypothetical protein FD167_3562, partial [bacterium]
FARKLILEGTRSDNPISQTPFKLSKSKLNEPTMFEFIFKHHGIIYTYGAKVTRNIVLEEWLFAKPKNREVRFFERLTSPQGEVKIEVGAILTNSSSKQKNFLKYIAQGTRPNQLFLTEAIEKNVGDLKPVIDWFKQVLVIVGAEDKYIGLEMEAHNDKSFTHFMGDFLTLVSTGITKVETEEVTLDFDKHFFDIPEEIRRDLVEDFKSLPNTKNNFLVTLGSKQYTITKQEDGQLKVLMLNTQRKNDDGELIKFDIDEESEGTQRLIHLIPVLFTLKIQQQEKVFFIDELDRRLHPLLTKAYVKAILDSTSKGQFIFTTHDTNLLDLELLRRDEIWFTEKDEHGASHLSSLIEFKVRPDLQIQKGYLAGRLGAIPFIGDINRLFPNVLSSKEN